MSAAHRRGAANTARPKPYDRPADRHDRGVIGTLFGYAAAPIRWGASLFSSAEPDNVSAAGSGGITNGEGVGPSPGSALQLNAEQVQGLLRRVEMLEAERTSSFQTPESSTLLPQSAEAPLQASDAAATVPVPKPQAQQDVQPTADEEQSLMRPIPKRAMFDASASSLKTPTDIVRQYMGKKTKRNEDPRPPYAALATSAELFNDPSPLGGTSSGRAEQRSAFQAPLTSALWAYGAECARAAPSAYMLSYSATPAPRFRLCDFAPSSRPAHHAPTTPSPASFPLRSFEAPSVPRFAAAAESTPRSAKRDHSQLALASSVPDGELSADRSAKQRRLTALHASPSRNAPLATSAASCQAAQRILRALDMMDAPPLSRGQGLPDRFPKAAAVEAERAAPRAEDSVACMLQQASAAREAARATPSRSAAPAPATAEAASSKTLTTFDSTGAPAQTSSTSTAVPPSATPPLFTGSCAGLSNGSCNCTKPPAPAVPPAGFSFGVPASGSSPAIAPAAAAVGTFAPSPDVGGVAAGGFPGFALPPVGGRDAPTLGPLPTFSAEPSPVPAAAPAGARSSSSAVSSSFKAPKASSHRTHEKAPGGIAHTAVSTPASTGTAPPFSPPPASKMGTPVAVSRGKFSFTPSKGTRTPRGGGEPSPLRSPLIFKFKRPSVLNSIVGASSKGPTPASTPACAPVPSCGGGVANPLFTTRSTALTQLVPTPEQPKSSAGSLGADAVCGASRFPACSGSVFGTSSSPLKQDEIAFGAAQPKVAAGTPAASTLLPPPTFTFGQAPSPAPTKSSFPDSAAIPRTFSNTPLSQQSCGTTPPFKFGAAKTAATVANSGLSASSSVPADAAAAPSPAAAQPSGAAGLFGGRADTGSKSIFGSAPASGPTGSPSAVAPTFTFGSLPTSSAPAPTSTPVVPPLFSFGSSAAASTPAPAAASLPSCSPAALSTVFGGAASLPATVAPGGAATTSQAVFSFGAPAASSTPAAPPLADTSAAPKPVFTFGAVPVGTASGATLPPAVGSGSAPVFSFGTGAKPPAGAAPLFGTGPTDAARGGLAPASSAFSFGHTSATPSFGVTAQSTVPSPSTNVQVGSSMQFGAPATTTGLGPGTTAAFGSAAPPAFGVAATGGSTPFALGGAGGGSSGGPFQASEPTASASAGAGRPVRRFKRPAKDA